MDELSPKIRDMLGDGTIARQSQFLATIKTDVPYDIDTLNFKRETRDVIYTPALIEFLKRYEFRSLLPSDITVSTPVYTLENPTKIANADTMRQLESYIHNDLQPYSLSTSGYPMLTALYIALAEDDVYKIDLQDDYAPLFVRHILDQPGSMVTYNWKEHARCMMWWLEYDQKNLQLPMFS